MSPAVTRRAALVGAAALLPFARAGAATPLTAESLQAATARIAAIEKQNGGRLGVYVLDTGTGAHLAHRADERFPMCSTHKFLTVAAILAQVDQGRLTLEQHVAYGQADLLSYAPVTRKHVGAGFMMVGALCAAAIEWSDNTAANLLLRLVGGPAGWTRTARSLGDQVSRLDRTEPELNTAIPGDPRDTTSPAAMVHDLDEVLLGKVLTPASRQRLEGWMENGKVSGKLLRASLPSGWRIGDKSGAGDHGTRNDIAILRPPHGAPILVAAYYTGSAGPLSSRERVIAETGRIVVDTF